MKFIFDSRSSCCGAKSVRLTSTNYLLEQDVQKSVLQMFDRFYANYRTQPSTLVLTSAELTTLQNSVSASDFAFVNNTLLFRKVPVKVED